MADLEAGEDAMDFGEILSIKEETIWAFYNDMGWEDYVWKRITYKGQTTESLILLHLLVLLREQR